MTSVKTTAALLLALGLAGCSTPHSVAQQHGQGRHEAFTADYNTVWSATLGAAACNDLRVLNADRDRGFISARRDMGVAGFGENVAIWVRPLNPDITEVEVVSRPAGPLLAPPPQLERGVLKFVETCLGG